MSDPEWEAFKAGFFTSAEGFNGETLTDNPPDMLDWGTLKRAFNSFKATGKYRDV